MLRKASPSAQAYCTRRCVLAWAAEGSQKDRLLRSWEGRGPVIACKGKEGGGGVAAACDSFGLWIQRQTGSCINPSTYKDKPLTLTRPGTLQEWVAFSLSPSFSTALPPHNLVKIRQLNNSRLQSLDFVTRCSSLQPLGFLDHARAICINTFGGNTNSI